MICPTNYATANFCQARSNPEPAAQRGSRSYLQLVSNIVLLLLTIFFYVPIFATEIRSPLAVEGVNNVGDTLLFAATALLAGFGAD